MIDLLVDAITATVNEDGQRRVHEDGQRRVQTYGAANPIRRQEACEQSKHEAGVAVGTLPSLIYVVDAGARIEA